MKEPNLADYSVIHVGGAQINADCRRKTKTRYLVLTENHLIRVRNQQRLAEIFPALALRLGIPSRHGTLLPSVSNNRTSTISVSSGTSQEQRSSFTSGTIGSIPLENIVAVCKSEGSPQSLDISYVNGAKEARFFQAQFPTERECKIWLALLRSSLKQHKFTVGLGHSTISYIANILHEELDYNSDAFRCFRVVRKISTKVCARTSSEERLIPEVYYLVIGAHKVHLIPPEHSSIECVSQGRASLGLMALTSILGGQEDDSFKLTFRLPFQKETSIYLSSASSWMIIDLIYQRATYLRPLWMRQPIVTNAKSAIDDREFVLDSALREEMFVRTLVAYCAAYTVNTSNICYTINYQSEDSPCFQLHAPANSSTYSARELLAIMRALRYNDLFVMISFSGVSLDNLEGLYDVFGNDTDAKITRDGLPIEIPEELKLSVLSQEVRALALQNISLTRVDFSRSISRVPNGSRDRGCGIPQAIFPLCRRKLTNINWITFTGIKLGAADLDYIIDAASAEDSRLRALEVGYCGLAPYDIDLIVSTIYAQEDTLETIDLSGPTGQLSYGTSQHMLSNLKYIRKLALSHISYDKDKRSFLDKEILCSWRLEELILSDTKLNQSLINTLRDYLADPASHTLVELGLDRCGLTEHDIKSFAPYMMGHSGKPRNLRLSLSGNHLHHDYSYLYEAIRRNQTPTHLTIKYTAFDEEKHFRELLDALRQNRSLEYVDMSNSSLPHDVGIETSAALRRMFAENTTLRYLDISGDSAHLDSARFGIGLNDALMGLTQNHALEVLRIERQKLGMQGANTLASVLLENRTLREIHCEDNDFNVNALRAVVNAVAENQSLVYLSSMNKDRETCIQKIGKGSYRSGGLTWPNSQSSETNLTVRKRSFRKSMIDAAGGTAGRLRRHSPTAPPTPTSTISVDSSMRTASSPSISYMMSSDTCDALRLFEEEWDAEMSRLDGYLQDNYQLVNGLIPRSGLNRRMSSKHSAKGSSGRPTTFTFMKPVHIETEISADEALSSPVSLSEFIRETELDKGFSLGMPSPTSSPAEDYIQPHSEHQKRSSSPRSLQTFLRERHYPSDQVHQMQQSKSSPSLVQVAKRTHSRKEALRSKCRQEHQRLQTSASFGLGQMCKELLVSKLLARGTSSSRASIAGHIDGMKSISGPQHFRTQSTLSLKKPISTSLA